MNELVYMNGNVAVTTSRTVAEYFGMQHKNVLQVIDSKKSTAENSALLDSMFFESTYRASNGKSNREVIMNRDGFSLLAMGFTGAKALQFQLKFIAEFNRMETALRAQAIPSYQIEDEIERAIRWAEERREEREKRVILETTISEQLPMVKLAVERISKGGCMSITDITKTFALKRGQLTAYAKENGYIHKKNTEVNKRGEEYFKVYDNNGYRAIGVTEAGVYWVSELVENGILGV
ncbi:MAG: Rha family transcriptional regulator [Bacilli bacterium]